MNNSIYDYDAANHTGYNSNGKPVDYYDSKSRVKWIYINSNDDVDHWMGIPEEK